jgi:hypothetical protein
MISLSSCPRALEMSQDALADACCVCDKAASLRDMIKGTPWKMNSPFEWNLLAVCAICADN